MKPKIEINQMTREQLAQCYRENIGYNPFLDDAQITEKEVAQTLTEYFEEDAVAQTMAGILAARLTGDEATRQKRDHEEQIFTFRAEDSQ